jgi:dihydropteroate synthase
VLYDSLRLTFFSASLREPKTMTETLYLRPIALAISPQCEEGEAVRLAGGLIYASRFALITRANGKVTRNIRLSVPNIPAAFDNLPAELQTEAQTQWADLRASHAPLQCGQRIIRLDQPSIMGILNVTPDSFSDGGKFLDNPEEASNHAAMMLESGAAIIDIGGESTRPGAAAVWEGDELKRVEPVVQRLAAMGAAISIDTRRVSVMEAALSAGAHIINDVSGLQYDPRSLEFAKNSSAPVILMHSPAQGSGEGADIHADGKYQNVVLDVFDWLRARRDAVIAAGIPRDTIILDVGIGFGKSVAENLALLNALPLFHALGQSLLVGASRKRMIGALSNESPTHKRLGGSLALAVRAMESGVQIIRVHDVPETVQAMHIWRGLRDAALTDFSMLAPES